MNEWTNSIEKKQINSNSGDFTFGECCPVGGYKQFEVWGVKSEFANKSHLGLHSKGISERH